jgi:hypothetical protein
VDGELVFRVTHPFHPLFGQQFPLLSQRNTWGDPRILFYDTTTGRVRSISTAWTNLAPPDPFVQRAAGRALLRLTDLQELVRLVSVLQTALSDGT